MPYRAKWILKKVKEDLADLMRTDSYFLKHLQELEDEERSGINQINLCGVASLGLGVVRDRYGIDIANLEETRRRFSKITSPILIHRAYALGALSGFINTNRRKINYRLPEEERTEEKVDIVDRLDEEIYNVSSEIKAANKKYQRKTDYERGIMYSLNISRKPEKFLYAFPEKKFPENDLPVACVDFLRDAGRYYTPTGTQGGVKTERMFFNEMRSYTLGGEIAHSFLYGARLGVHVMFSMMEHGLDWKATIYPTFVEAEKRREEWIQLLLTNIATIAKLNLVNGMRKTQLTQREKEIVLRLLDPKEDKSLIEMVKSGEIA
ncbi:MAG: hypothetical protein ABH829_03130 [archaeon]